MSSSSVYSRWDWWRASKAENAFLEAILHAQNNGAPKTENHVSEHRFYETLTLAMRFS